MDANGEEEDEEEWTGTLGSFRQMAGRRRGGDLRLMKNKPLVVAHGGSGMFTSSTHCSGDLCGGKLRFMMWWRFGQAKDGRGSFQKSGGAAVWRLVFFFFFFLLNSFSFWRNYTVIWFNWLNGGLF